ncbi:MAG: WecB/TagA/CpsF family glycosyltransferase [Verrucomicrobium sp.]|nr:WecB/TagA/CpsF family glycosyltransferase [Verrucomicrobium sp.]
MASAARGQDIPFPAFACGPVAFRDVTAAEIVAEVARPAGPAPRLFTALNAHALSLALQQPRFRDLLNRSHLCFCDGFGILLFCRLWGFGAPRHRNTPTDFLPALLERLAAEKKTVFLLGDTEAVAAAYARQLEARHPGLVCGWHSGFFPRGGEEEAALLARIAAARPHALLLGMGMPRQEYWAEDHQAALSCASVVMIGASMAFHTGSRRRGPRWATGRGLEGVFRLLLEPRVVWHRYLVELPRLAWALRRYRKK